MSNTDTTAAQAATSAAPVTPATALSVPSDAVAVDTDPWLSADELQEIAYAYDNGLLVLLGQC